MQEFDAKQQSCYLILYRLSPELQPGNGSACVPEHQHKTAAAAWRAFKVQQRLAAEHGSTRMPVRQYAAAEFRRTGRFTQFGAEHLELVWVLPCPSAKPVITTLSARSAQCVGASHLAGKAVYLYRRPSGAFDGYVDGRFLASFGTPADAKMRGGTWRHAFGELPEVFRRFSKKRLSELAAWRRHTGFSGGTL